MANGLVVRCAAVVERVANMGSVRYRTPTLLDYAGVWQAQTALEEYLRRNADKYPSRIPDEYISTDEIRRISVPLYGVKTWQNVFAKRQQLVLALYADAIRDVKEADIARAAGLVLDRVVMLFSGHCSWKAPGESLIDMFGRHAIGMVLDFAEAVAVASSTSIFTRFLDSVSEGLLASCFLRCCPPSFLCFPYGLADFWGHGTLLSRFVPGN